MRTCVSKAPSFFQKRNQLFTIIINCACILAETGDHLEEFALDGLRTLCFAYAKIDPRIYQVDAVASLAPAAVFKLVGVDVECLRSNNGSRQKLANIMCCAV